jgi:cysteine-rich CWC protein
VVGIGDGVATADGLSARGARRRSRHRAVSGAVSTRRLAIAAPAGPASYDTEPGRRAAERRKPRRASMRGVPRMSVCERCGRTFACGADDAACWCRVVVAGPEALTVLARDFSRCVCPACLRDPDLARGPGTIVRAGLRIGWQLRGS